MKNIKKIFQVLVASSLLLLLGVGMIPSKTFAAPAISYKDNYKIWLSGELLARCVGSGGFNPDANKANSQEAINNLFDNGVKFQDGKLYSRIVGGTNNQDSSYDCNTIDDVNPAIGALGIQNGIYGLYDKLGGNKLSKAEAEDAIRKLAIAKGATDKLSQQADFQFWFWSEIFKNAVNEGGCGGVLSDQPSSTAKSNIDDATKPFYAVANGSTEPVGYRVASFGVEFGDELEGVDEFMYGTLNEGRLTCRIVARQLTKARADAYFNALKTNPAASAQNNPTTSTGQDEATGGEETIEAQCTASFSTFATSWFVCPLITGFAKAVQELDTQITNQLTINTNEYFSGTQGESFKKVWTSMRNLALAFIVIVGLLMVIGTAVEVGPFDPYTVKKVMPRLLIAVIVISLSWPLIIFLIEASNSLGYTIRGLIEAPFRDSLNTAVQFGGGQQWLAAAGLVGLAIALGPIGILSFVGTAFLAVLIAFLTIILRQILVILLAVLAPIAIAMYILPNTQKAGKTWWDLFSKALLVFPIIAAFIASGRVFAVVAASSSSGENAGTIKGFIAFAAYFGPYFALPFAFRLAGGAIGQIGGFVNDRSRGGFDRLKKFRQGQTQKNAQKVVGGNRFKETGVLNRLNTPLQGAAIAATGRAGVNPRTMRSKIASAQEQQALSQAQELLEKNEAFRQIAGDDDLLRAVSSDGDRAAITSYLAGTRRFNASELPGLVNMVEQARNSGSRSATRKASTLGLTATSTGFATSAEMYDAINSSTDDVAVRNAMIAKAKSLSANGGRYDMSEAGHVDQYAAAADLANGVRTAAQVNHDMRAASFAQGGVHKMVGMKSSAFGAVATQLADDYQDAVNSGDHSRATELASEMVSLRNASGSASPANREHITAMLEASGIDIGSEQSVDQQFGEGLGTRFGLNAREVTEELRTRAGLYDQPAGQSQVNPNIIPGMGPIGTPGPTPPGGVAGP